MKSNHWKLNFDAAWDERSNRGGIGWAVHDSNGSLICVCMEKIIRKWNTKTLKAKAILEGMKMIVNSCKQNQTPLEVESDALEVINSLSGTLEDLSEMKQITDSILCLASRFKAVKFHHCRRAANTVVHYVAKLACNFVFVSDLYLYTFSLRFTRVELLVGLVF